jgi:hypothetical protein
MTTSSSLLTSMLPLVGFKYTAVSSPHALVHRSMVLIETASFGHKHADAVYLTDPATALTAHKAYPNMSVDVLLKMPAKMLSKLWFDARAILAYHFP